jgi:2-oxoglutarate/2-oxoacid ferredoxin oxidoreductase subunit alpha
MEDVNVVIAGTAGEGVQTIGDVLAETASAQGYAVFSWKEYESRIRGGQNSYSIRIGEKAHNAPMEAADILLCLNRGAARKYEPHLRKGGVLLAEEKLKDNMIKIPFTEISKQVAGAKIYANTVAVGALTAVLGMELDHLKTVLEKQFSDKGSKIIQANFAAAEKGFFQAESDCKDVCPWKLPLREASFLLISGNQAIPLGAARAGCRFMAAYPMTPSTGIITFLSKEQERLGVFTEQAEDEISAVNMAIGASYAGARAMTATSGGGFSLMTEGVSLAGMTETPLVIILAQRPGPATGLPTRTAQGDLLFSINAGHGEFPKLVLAPSDAADAFYKTVRAFNLADKYQIPVIILTDQFLADAHFSIMDLDLEKAPPETYLADPERMEGYERYTFVEAGVSPRLYPGQSRHLVCVDSDEHDETGHITEDLSKIAMPMAEKRMTKLGSLKDEIMPPEEINVADAKFVLIGWGSTRGALIEAVERLNSEGKEVGALHFTELWPLPRYKFPEGKTFLTVEGNMSGQLASLLKSEYRIEIDGILSRHDGLPITAEFIRRTFNG